MVEQSENGLISGIAPKRVEHMVPPPTKEFKPWHKPRKQWMRMQQWVKETESLISTLRLDGRPLRYLSLPGEDMLDIRVLSELCSQKNVRLKCLGYDEGARDRTAETEINISRNEVSATVEPGSVIIPDNLSVLKNVTSQGFSYVRNHGPFDVINLDLCGSVSCINEPDNHQVLHNLCEYQIQHSRETWLLFLTTRAEYEKVNIEHLPYYLKCLKNNAEKNVSFGEQLLGIANYDVARYHDGGDINHILEGCRDSHFVKLFASGFGKWLLQLLEDTNKSWIVEMLDSCWYRVEGNQSPDSFPNMLSLSFRFSPVNKPLTDATGLSRPNPGPDIDESALAMAILTQTERIRDIDREVDADPELWKFLVEDSASLLKTARYSVDSYPKWAEEKKIRFSTN